VASCFDIDEETRMNKTLAARVNIYDHIESSQCEWTDRATHDEFEIYCIAKDTIQDTAEALMAHREKGFASDVSRRYIEYYGVLQAVYMQQDAIQALFKLFLPSRPLDFSSLPVWKELRDLRNDTVGHPVGRRKRLNRNVIGYDRVNYMWCPGDTIASWKSRDVNLTTLLDAYDTEAAGVLKLIHHELELVCSREDGRSKA
jgi:hypothetical protein